jgi:hypothetical protein
MMTSNSLLKNIKTQIAKGKSPLVVLPLEEWQKVEDVLEELSSPMLQKTISKAREDYKKGKAIPYF